jgi:hypothetical protein
VDNRRYLYGVDIGARKCLKGIMWTSSSGSGLSDLEGAQNDAQVADDLGGNIKTT